MFKLTTFIHYEILLIYTKCGARVYANCIVVRAAHGNFRWNSLWSFHAFLSSECRVRSFGRIRIRISDLWRSFRANPFSDQWSIKSTLDKDKSDHWSVWSKDGSLDHWSNAFLWAKDPKLIILPSGAQFQTNRCFVNWPEIDRKDCWQSLHKFCDKHEIKSIL